MTGGVVLIYTRLMFTCYWGINHRVACIQYNKRHAYTMVTKDGYDENNNPVDIYYCMKTLTRHSQINYMDRCITK